VPANNEFVQMPLNLEFGGRRLRSQRRYWYLFPIVSGFLLLFISACEDIPRSSATVPDFSGHWEHMIAHYLSPADGQGPVTNIPGLTFASMNVWVGDYRNPVLLPWASERVKDHAVEELERGEPLWEQERLCRAFGVPHILLLREPIEILQEDTAVTILYHHDNQVRRIPLNAKHHVTPNPSPYGDSVGHYEGSTLVIDTLALSDTGPIDNYGTPHSEALHVVERYNHNPIDGALRVDFFVEDQKTFATAWRGVQLYQRLPEPEGFRENICADNIRYGVANEYPVPRDDTPDF
jgi:hypothetical protein